MEDGRARHLFHLPFFFHLVLTILPSAVCHLTSSAQLFDTIQASFHTKPKLIAGFATKTAFVSSFRSPVFTAKAGLEFNHRVRIGAGISWLQLSRYKKGIDNKPFYLDKTFSDASGIYTVHPALQFRYVHLFFEYIYFRNRKWQCSIPLQLGIGSSSYKYNFNGEDFIESPHTILLYEPAVSGQYKITRWLGAGLDVGLRVMLITNKNIGSRFDSPVYDIKVLVFWGELYRMVFPKK